MSALELAAIAIGISLLAAVVVYLRRRKKQQTPHEDPMEWRRHGGGCGGEAPD